MRSNSVGAHLTGENLKVGDGQVSALHPEVEVACLDHFDAVDEAMVTGNVDEVTQILSADGFGLVGSVNVAVWVEHHTAPLDDDTVADDLFACVKLRAGCKIEVGVVSFKIQHGGIFGLVPALNVDNVGVVLVGLVGLGLVGKERQN